MGFLRRVTLARNIQGSNSIEGYSVSLDDAVAAAEGEEPLDANTETRAALRGYREAMTYVLQLADDGHFDWDETLLRSLHYMMISYDLSKRPGRWRLGPTFVRRDADGATVYEGPAPELVPALMGELMATLRSDGSSPLVRAAMAHLNLVMIRPFRDGNGRMARCLQTLVLAREGSSRPSSRASRSIWAGTRRLTTTRSRTWVAGTGVRNGTLGRGSVSASLPTTARRTRSCGG